MSRISFAAKQRFPLGLPPRAEITCLIRAACTQTAPTLTPGLISGAHARRKRHNLPAPLPVGDAG
jgi:hypothetical protein